MQSLMLPQELGEKIDKSELYRQCSPRRVMNTAMYELENCEYVSSVIKIEAVLDIEWEKMGTLEILMSINDGVYVCICSVYSIFLMKYTQHAFVYDSYFTTTGNNRCQGAIIDNRRHARICVLKKNIENQSQNWRICLGNSLKANAKWCMHTKLLHMTPNDI